MSSVIVVDSEFQTSVKDYAEVIDSVNQSREFSQSVKPFINEITGDISNKKELANKIIESSSPANLTKLSDKDFEPTFNLIVYLLSQLEEPFTSYEQIFNKDSAIVKNLIASTPKERASLRDRKAIKFTTILSVLNTIFNFLPETSSSRIYILDTILDVFGKSDQEFTLIQNPLGQNLVQWLKKANASDEQIKALFWKFIKLDNLHSYQSLQVIKDFTSQYSVSLNELHDLIKFAVLSESADVSLLINNNVAQVIGQNSGDELVQFFQAYARGDILSAVPAPLSDSSDFILAKSKILSLTQFFIENDNANKTVFKYDDIPSVLVSSPQEFEQLLITAIKSGLVEGKLHQIDQTFHLTKVQRFIIAGDQENLAKNWEYVKQVLIDWRIALDNLDEVVNTSRDQITNNNN